MIFRRSLLLPLAVCVLLTACDDDNKSTLAAFAMPGDMHVVTNCLIGGVYSSQGETECTEAGGKYKRTLFVSNIDSATLSYVPFYKTDSEFEVIDTTTAVPGVTSISVGERPHSVAGDELGAFVVLVSSIDNDMSVVFVNDKRETAWQKLDKTPRKIIYHAAEQAYYVYFSEGLIRRLNIEYDCGKGKNILTENCSLTKEAIKLSWSNAGKLDGHVADYVDNPVKNIGYVTYADRRYVSVIGYDAGQGACMDGSSVYPCEVRRIGAGFECADGIDNDGDGSIDSGDAKCFYPWSTESIGEDAVGWRGIGECADNLDNDGDGFIDALDPGCVSSNDASEQDGYQPMVIGTCGDGIDNNGDGDIDRDDVKCAWPTDDESDAALSSTLGIGMCRDGKDNDGDGKIDAEDLACYGKNGFGESLFYSENRGPVSIDPRGRWLYVLDPVDSQLIVIDLETEKTLDHSGWYPRSRHIGIPVSRLALAVAGDIRYQEIYNKNDHRVVAERAVVFVSSSSGAVVEYLIHQKLSHYYKTTEMETVSEMALRASDGDDDASYVGVVRCVGRICTENDLPVITLRRRPAVSYYADEHILSENNPKTGKRHSVVYDNIINSETWRLAYEGTLEDDERTDGYFDKTGAFHSVMDFCMLGAQNGDRLILKKTSPRNLPQCAPYAGKNLEWTVIDAGPKSLRLAATGDSADAPIPPIADCFSDGLTYEIRASKQWLITSNSTYINRRFALGNHCIDDPRRLYGQTRFSFDPAAGKDVDAQTAFFGIKMPANAAVLKRGDAFEFTTRTGQSNINITVGASPNAMKVFKTLNRNFLIISEASANTVVVYDIDDESIDDTL